MVDYSKWKDIEISDDEEQELQKKTPWNNNFKKRNETELSKEEKHKKLEEFIKQHKNAMQTYGMLKKYDDSKRFLTEHPHLVSEYTVNYLMIWCIDLEMKKHDLMGHVAHQCMCMRYVLKVSEKSDRDLQSCIEAVFMGTQNFTLEYRQTFDKDLQGFIKVLKRRAQEKLEEAKQEEKEKQDKLGPGGLDPVKAYESLP